MEAIQHIKPPKEILLIDDDKDFRMTIGSVLKASGFKVIEAKNGPEGLKYFKSKNPSLILLDYKMPRMDGLTVARELKKIEPLVPIVMITAFAEVNSAVEAMKVGVYDYITKPVDNNDLVFTINRAIEKRELANEVNRLKKIIKKKSSLYEYMGNSSQVARVVKLVEKVSPTFFTVLIEGESGTGKELVARAIHDMSELRDGPFVAVDCGAIPETLIESELFGHVKGAFTNADIDRPGQFELAENGTLFLDEIGNLPYSAQKKLLRTMQERYVKRLGAKKARPVKVRIVVATNQSLLEDVNSGKFRKDLYYRLNEFYINIPTLRERRKDIIYLAKMFVTEVNFELGKNIKGIEKEAINILISYNWPGNVRELKNIIRQAALMCEDNESIRPDELMMEHDSAGDKKCFEQVSNSELLDRNTTLKESVKIYSDIMERQIIDKVLSQVKGNKSKAAKILGVDYKTLLRKIKKHRMN